MNQDSSPKSRRDVFKMLDLEHLNNEEFQLFNERKLNNKDMLWAVLHLSECRKCCLLASKLTAQEIETTLTGTKYGRAEIIQQTIEYYFQTLKRKE